MAGTDGAARPHRRHVDRAAADAAVSTAWPEPCQNPDRSPMDPVSVTAEPAPAPERDCWPLVSVIMPTRGRPELVRESIAAVVAQSYPGQIECLVVHDREPPDEELTKLGAAQHRVAVAANTHSPGLAGARNTGLDLAHGSIIATC